MKILSFFVLALLTFTVKTLCAQGVTGSAGEARKILNINSKADDFGAVLSEDELKIYFSSNRFGKNHIYEAKRKTIDSPWDDPDYCKVTSNPQDIITAICLDQIGRYYIATNRETRTNGDINIWEGFGLDSSITARMLPPPVNTYKWESQPSVTGDGKNLYFVSNRESPAGSIEMLTDIFVTHRNSDGTWTDPQNLGPGVNIGVYNSTPFISPDGRFLFFSSKEKRGIEIKRRLYMTEHTGPTDRDWSKPFLLPAPMNSDKDDIYPVIAKGGKKILFSSNREGGSGFDIYEADIPPNIQEKITKSFPAK